MTVIKKQVFRPSRDENLQQFLAKDGAEMRWGQPASKNKAKTRARAAGKIIGVPEKEGDAAKKASPKPHEVPSDPVSGQDLPGEIEDREVTQKAFEVDPEGGTRRVPSADDKKKAARAKRDRLFERSVNYVKNLEDQGSDNSNSADDTTGKQIKLAVQDAWFEKSNYMSAEEQADFSPEELAEHRKRKLYPKHKIISPPSKKKAGNELTSSKSGEPTRTPGKGQTAKFREGKWQSKMQKAVWDAWFEKARSRRNQEKVRETRRRWRGDDSPPKNRQDRALTSQTLEEERDWQNDPYRPSLDAGETEWSYRQDAKPDEKTRRRRYRKHQGDSNRDITTQVSNPERKPLSEYGNKRTKKLVGRARKEQRSPAVKANRKASNAESSLPNRSNYSASDQYAHDMKEARRKIADG
jgi:hypothetical protein